MIYEIDPKIFEEDTQSAFGVVIVTGVDNTRETPMVTKLLEKAAAAAGSDVVSADPLTDLGNLVSLRFGLDIESHDLYELIRKGGPAPVTEKTGGAVYHIYSTDTADMKPVEKAMKEFCELVANYYARSGYSCTVTTGIADANNSQFEL